MIRAAACAALLASTGCAQARGPGGEVPVAGPAALRTALAAARGGEVLRLPPGDYGALELRARTFDQPVTLAGDRAVFDRITLDRVQGLTLRGLTVAGRLGAGETDKTRFVQVNRSARVAWEGGSIAGTPDGDPDNDGMGLSVRDSTDVSVRGVRFHDLYRAAVFARSQRLTVAGNRVDTIRSDGFNFAGVEDVVIENNRFTDFFRSAEAGDHPDFIQFWARGAGPSSRVVIRGNVMTEGRGRTTQGIFIDNKTGRVDGVTQYGDPHRDFTITGNLYYGSSTHGISLTGVEGARVSGNTAAGWPGAQRRVGINTWRTRGVTVEGNVACGYGAGDAPRGRGAASIPVLPPGNVLLGCRPGDRGAAPASVFGAWPAVDTPPETLGARGAEGWRPAGGVALGVRGG